jgi:hypothetical protein
VFRINAFPPSCSDSAHFRADLLVGSGDGTVGRVTGYSGRIVTDGDTIGNRLFDFAANPASGNGVFVGSAPSVR